MGDKYVGFMKYHPHDEHSVLRVAFTSYVAKNKKVMKMMIII